MGFEHPRYCTRCGSLHIERIEGCAPVTVWAKSPSEKPPEIWKKPAGNWRVYAWQCFDCHKIINVVEILNGPGFPGRPDPGRHRNSIKREG